MILDTHQEERQDSDAPFQSSSFNWPRSPVVLDSLGSGASGLVASAPRTSGVTFHATVVIFILGPLALKTIPRLHLFALKARDMPAQGNAQDRSMVFLNAHV